MLESKFQSKLVEELRSTFPGIDVAKTDSSSVQGLADLILLYGDKFVILECKRSEHEKHQPNQDYYVNKYRNAGTPSCFVFPENKDETIERLKAYFKTE